MELDIKIYEEKFHRIGKECDERSQHKTAIAQLVSLFEKMRTHNQELHGEVEEKNYDIGNLRDQLKKMEYKYFSMTQNKILQKKKPRKLQIMK